MTARTRWALRLAFAGLLAAGGSACGLLEPQGVAGTYTLYRVNGDAAARPIGEKSGRYPGVVGAMVRLSEGGTATIRLTVRRPEGFEYGPEIERTSYTGTYAVTGDRLTFSWLLPREQDAPGIGADGVVLSSGEIVVAAHIARSGPGGFVTNTIPMILRR